MQQMNLGAAFKDEILIHVKSSYHCLTVLALARTVIKWHILLMSFTEMYQLKNDLQIQTVITYTAKKDDFFIWCSMPQSFSVYTSSWVSHHSRTMYVMYDKLTFQKTTKNPCKLTEMSCLKVLSSKKRYRKYFTLHVPEQPMAAFITETLHCYGPYNSLNKGHIMTSLHYCAVTQLLTSHYYYYCY